MTQLPDLPPRPETPANAAFRREFYRRWGKENWIVAGPAERAEYARHPQTLSIKSVARGREHYFVDRRRITVSDETYLILNEAREYSSLLEGPQAAYSFCIFFRPTMANEAAGGVLQTVGSALEDGVEPRKAPVEFAEHLRRHDGSVTPVLRFIQRHVELGVADAEWCEEQFMFLLCRILKSENRLRRQSERLDNVGAAKRLELVKRIGWATDFIHSNLHRDITLADLASAARLSVFHFLRTFAQVYAITPMAYVREQRTQRALALLRSTTLEISEVAAQVGLSRLALWRYLHDATGAGPRELRRSHQRCDPLPSVSF